MRAVFRGWDGKCSMYFSFSYFFFFFFNLDDDVDGCLM